MTRYIVTTAITAYQQYSVHADDEQAARDAVYDAIKTGDDAILGTAQPRGFNDDEQIIDSEPATP